MMVIVHVLCIFTFSRIRSFCVANFQNDICDDMCNFPSCQYDGGDCDTSQPDPTSGLVSTIN